MNIKNLLPTLLVLPVSLAVVSCTHTPHTANKPVVSESAAKPERKPAFVAKKASEAILTYSHSVLLEADHKPNAAEAKEQIEAQVLHLFGPMERADYPGVPKEDHKVKVTAIEAVSDTPGTFKISYDYRGTVVVASGPRKYLDLILPKNPDAIYDAGKNARGVNLCTDEHYQAQGDFWYFWSPAPSYPKCKLEEGVHYDVVRGNIERIPRSDQDIGSTYPEYHRLAKDGVIDIYAFIGMDDPEKYGRNPRTSRDVNAPTYRRIREFMVEAGFELRTIDADEIRKTVPLEEDSEIPYFEEGVKKYPNKNLTIRIRLMFGEMGITEESLVFHHYFKEALENGSVMLYDGHSGLGGNLDLAEIQNLRDFKIKLNKNRYQMYFFNSCTSYTYYNALYFQKKRRKSVIDPKGTKNLDVLANGLSTDFDTLASGNVAILRAIENWATRGTWTSYQRLARIIDSDNLFTVNGDEDNPTAPVR